GVFASVIGSNIGAFLTPVGALAGIMWSSILRHNGIKFSFVDFLKYGFAIAIPTLLASLGGLYLSFAIIG
ncbi:MAG: ArsB/NhaD family transporter, partial [Clostridia bacterium]